MLITNPQRCSINGVNNAKNDKKTIKKSFMHMQTHLHRQQGANHERLHLLSS